MCGRFSLALEPEDLQLAFPDFTFPIEVIPRYNVAPSQPVLVVPNDGSGAADFFKWGLIPSWAKDPSIGDRLINARAETLAEKPSFRSAFKYRRCLVLANGFFEWHSRPGTKIKVPYFIHFKDGEPFAFAGLWERWQSLDGSEIRTTTIITTEPNPLVARIHKRMPLILPRESYAQWLHPSPQAPVDLQPLLVPFPSESMEAYPVSTLVNSPGNETPDILVKA